MKNKRLFFGLTISFMLLSLVSHSQVKKACTRCEQLLQLQLPDVTILRAESVTSETLPSEVPYFPPVLVSVPFCKIYGRISKEINFELLVPQQWNGRFLMSGGGGFVGKVQNNLRDYVNKGYATAGTDTGHEADYGAADWALNNMERQLNFGRLGVHRTAVVSKALIRALFCEDPSYSYFIGCSRGGGQSLMEAQYYPDDFNGYVAGAPAFSWPAAGAKFLSECVVNYPNSQDVSKPVITNDNLKVIQEYVLKQCDLVDGVADKIINEPQHCKIDLSKLPLCPDGEPGPGCLTHAQLEVFKSIYNPLVIDNTTVYPGFPFGLESEPGGWDMWIAGTSPYFQNAPSLHYSLGTEMFKYLVFNDPSWDYSNYDFKRVLRDTRFAASYLDATNTDYSDLKKRKGKLIIYHGWHDPALSAYSTIDHYNEALKKDKELPEYVRLFMLPGVLHCTGGTGPDQTDWLKLIQDWVEHQQAPERIVLHKMENGKSIMTRPVFPYPSGVEYNGKGDTNVEQNFRVKKAK